MITVPDAARRVGRNPETIRRWIRDGKLASRKIGTQHLIAEEDLATLVGSSPPHLPDSWKVTVTGEPMPNWVDLLRRSRTGR